MPSSSNPQLTNFGQHLEAVVATSSSPLIPTVVSTSSEEISICSSEERERKLFMGDINKFMAEIGKPLSKIPIMGYKELDLYQLFKEVTAYGGFIEVVKNVGTWSKIWKRLGNFDPSITDSSFRLKKNYERYLLDYEYKCFPDHRQQAIELEKQMQLKKSQQNSSTDPLNRTTSVGNAGDLNKKTLKSLDPLNKSIKSKKAKRKSYSGYKEIVREKNGSPKMPLCLGELTVECLGTILPYSPYITEKHIWPVGFKSCRFFSSMANPQVRVKYTSMIVEGGDKPQFIVIAEDEPENKIISYSPSGAWRTILKRVMEKGGNDEIRKSQSASGTLRFGLSHPIISHLIRELPGADKCKLEGNSSASSSPSNSPSLGRKRRNDEELSDVDSDDSFGKRQRRDSSDEDYTIEEYEAHFSRGVFATRKEIDDLESAVATLQALKYCSVY